MNSTYRDISNEVQNFRDYMMQENQRLSSSYSLYVTILTSLFAVAIALFGFFAWQSKKEVKASFAKQLQQAQATAQATFEHQLQETHAQMEQDFRQIIESEASTFKQLADNERVFTTTNILLIATKSEIQRMEENELRSIRRRGIKNITTMEYDQKVLQKAIKSNIYNIIIYHYLTPSTTPHTVAIAELLLSEQYEIPYIVYTYGGGHIPRIDIERLQKYLWYVMANFPVSLASYLFSLAYAFNQNQPTYNHPIYRGDQR